MEVDHVVLECLQINNTFFSAKRVVGVKVEGFYIFFYFP